MTLAEIMGPDSLEAQVANLAKIVMEARVAAERSAKRAEAAEQRVYIEMQRFIEARDEAVRYVAKLKSHPALLEALNEVARG